MKSEKVKKCKFTVYVLCRTPSWCLSLTATVKEEAAGRSMRTSNGGRKFHRGAVRVEFPPETEEDKLLTHNLSNICQTICVSDGMTSF